MAKRINNKFENSLLHSLSYSSKMENRKNEKVAATIAHLYIEAIDNHRDRLNLCLHEEAVLDWFGRTICGNEEIISFLNSMFPFTVHYIHDVKACDLIEHRSKRSFNNNKNVDDKENSEDKENINDNLINMEMMGDTDENEYRTDISNEKMSLKRSNSLPIDYTVANPIANMINVLAGISQVMLGSTNTSKVPKLTPNFKISSVVIPPQCNGNNDVQNTERKALIIKGNLYIRSKHKTPAVWERKIKNIIIEYDSSIRLIVYEGKSNCCKNLSLLFNEMP